MVQYKRASFVIENNKYKGAPSFAKLIQIIEKEGRELPPNYDCVRYIRDNKKTVIEVTYEE
jgi:hypothetical protein